MHRKTGTDNAFYFKQFHIYHDRCTMKVGTDAILLGSWVNLADAINILDIGTGSGIIALMLAQRSKANTSIIGIEPDFESFKQASENIAASKWSSSVQILNCTLQNLKTENHYDLIVSNPPFFSDSMRPPDDHRKNSRHTDMLTHQELLAFAVNFLTPAGRLALILPFKEGEQVIVQAKKLNLQCIRLCNVKTREHKSTERLLIELSKQHQNPCHEELLLQVEDGARTLEYHALVGNFYLDKSAI